MGKGLVTLEWSDSVSRSVWLSHAKLKIKALIRPCTGVYVQVTTWLWWWSTQCCFLNCADHPDSSLHHPQTAPSTGCPLARWGQRTSQPLALSRGQGPPEVEGRELEGRDLLFDASGNAREEEDPIIKYGEGDIIKFINNFVKIVIVINISAQYNSQTMW